MSEQKNIIVFLLLVFVTNLISAQKSLNDYKYILVPKTFEFSKIEDEHKLNSLTKFLFNKYNYSTYFTDDNLPEDLAKNRCLALTAKVSNKKSGLFKTKLQIILIDCFGKEILSSAVGESRLKKYDRAYNEALRDAFNTFKNANYKYNQATKVKEQRVDTVSTKPSKAVNTNIATKEIISTNDTKEQIEDSKENKVLYAQKIKDGYQLVDSQPKIVMILLQTAAKDVFMVKGIDAIVYKKNDQWIYYEITDTNKITKELVIKF